MAVSPELLLMSAVSRTGEHKVLVKSGITASMFHQYPDEGKWFLEYITRYGRAPSRKTILNTWPDITLYKTDDVEYHADEVRKAHSQHGIMTLIENVVDAVETGDMDRAMATLRRDMLDVQMRQVGMADDYDAFSDWRETYSDVAMRVDRVNEFGLAGIPTGFESLDHYTGGFQPGWFNVIAARVGTGKTWTGIRSAFAGASTGSRIIYYSLEMGRHQVAMRMHSFASAKFGQKVVFNSLDLARGEGFDLKKYRNFLDELRDAIGDGKFYINDSSRGSVTPMSIAAGIEHNQPDIVYIDYLTLMGKSGDDWRATSNLSTEMKGVAERYRIPVVAMAQINRMGIGKEPPGPENLAQSDGIGHDADVLLTMAKQSARVMKMRLAKFRHGPDNQRWYCKFSPGTGQFDEIDGDEAAQLIEDDKDID